MMGHRIAVVLAGLVAIATTAWASIGDNGQWAKVILLFVACASTAAVVVLLPAGVRGKVGAFMGAFVAAAGILPVIVFFPESPEPAPNSRFTAELIRRGPFEEPLPEYLQAKGLADVGISDPSAAQALDAVQLVIVADPARDPHLGEESPGTQVFAHMEVYPSEPAARERAETSLRESLDRYDAGLEEVSPEGFCMLDPDFWLCAGHRGLVYAEVTLSPSANATLPMARGTLAAMLRYADDRMRLATE